MEATTPPLNYPEWTEYKEKNGLDPLGMQNASVNLYQTFLPGISNVTLRMRYYGLYAWLCRTYAREVRDTNPETWKRFIRRMEALYALISCRHGGEGGVAGIDWANRTMDNWSGDVIDFREAAEPGSANHYLQQAWGAYGAAYGGQLFEIGVLTGSKEHDIPLPSPDIGEPLASAFEESLGPLAEELLGVIERGAVTAAELDRFQSLAPSKIHVAGKERALYQEILLKQDSKDAAALSRRLSIMLILSIAGLLGRDPKPDEVRWILYAGCDAQGRILTLGAPALSAQRERWWVYQANDLCHVVFETLLKFTLDNIARYPAGIELQKLVPLCVQQILEAAESRPADWASFVGSIRPVQNAYGDDPESEWSLSQQIMRGAGRRGDKICPPEEAWNAIKLLAILHKRVGNEGHDIAAELGHFDPDAFRSLLTEARFLTRHADESFSALLERLLEERVVRRHLWVAFRKFRYQRDYTFLVEMDDGRLRLRDVDGPVFTNPRLGPAITFLKDIHLIGGQGLTDLGAQAVGS